jgi:beta-galactosidase
MKSSLIMQISTKIIVILSIAILSFNCKSEHSKARSIENFCNDWKFNLGDIANVQNPSFDDTKWRTLNLPHDWSVEGEFNEKNPATPGGGALPGGIGWYRKVFTLRESDKNKTIFIDFDGVYRNSEVWINGHYLGIRPYGYSSFRYEITPYLKYDKEKNIIAVKVDNSKQPNSRWYSGSGIYRNVWLIKTNNVFVDHWGTYITTSEVNDKTAKINIRTKVRNVARNNQQITLNTILYDNAGKEIGRITSNQMIPKDSVVEISQETTINSPMLWSIETPSLYKAVSQIENEQNISDEYETTFGIRDFVFTREKGFFLNGKPVKIKGVCNHHDLGCLGAAINTRAIERQLEILKGMGCNGIRTSHNPPAPELLDLCDKMGFIVMDEAFDMWKKQKTPFDYHRNWEQWHKRDLEDMLLRDRNHPSIFIWSIGNEITEQWQKNSGGDTIAKELRAIVKNLDKTRPITSACNNANPENIIILSNALDLTGLNYSIKSWIDFPEKFSGQTFIGTETTSALQTRGQYDMPSDSIRRWPSAWDKPLTNGNKDYTCSAYDNCSAPWGSTHEESWTVIKKYPFLSGMYIWTGFDYIGEPTPYPWPARSSYFGIIDLAGFPKDVYYMYQSEWTNKPVLHIFPHWNWKQGEVIDVWAYSNCQEVELFLNGKSLGTKHKIGDELHLAWRLPFAPGTLKAIARTNGKEILTQEVKTAGKPARIILSADRITIKAGANDLAFVTVKIVDSEGVMVPNADNLVKFDLAGDASIVGVDNGNPISHESFKANFRKAFNGLCLAVIQGKDKAGKIELTATAEGLQSGKISIDSKKE